METTSAAAKLEALQKKVRSQPFDQTISMKLRPLLLKYLAGDASAAQDIIKQAGEIAPMQAELWCSKKADYGDAAHKEVVLDSFRKDKAAGGGKEDEYKDWVVVFQQTLNEGRIINMVTYVYIICLSATTHPILALNATDLFYLVTTGESLDHIKLEACTKTFTKHCKSIHKQLRTKVKQSQPGNRLIQVDDEDWDPIESPWDVFQSRLEGHLTTGSKAVLVPTIPKNMEIYYNCFGPEGINIEAHPPFVEIFHRIKYKTCPPMTSEFFVYWAFSGEAISLHYFLGDLTLDGYMRELRTNLKEKGLWCWESNPSMVPLSEDVFAFVEEAVGGLLVAADAYFKTEASVANKKRLTRALGLVRRSHLAVWRQIKPALFRNPTSKKEQGANKDD